MMRMAALFASFSHAEFRLGKFFSFLVRRNSGNFAPARPRKSFAARRLGHGSEAKLTEFRPGGGAKLSAGGAKRAESRELGAKSGVRAPPSE